MSTPHGYSLVLIVLTMSSCRTLDGRPVLLMPRVCPDGGPVKFLQDPSCGRMCGYSCLPDRWDEGAR